MVPITLDLGTCLPNQHLLSLFRSLECVPSSVWFGLLPPNWSRRLRLLLLGANLHPSAVELVNSGSSATSLWIHSDSIYETTQPNIELGRTPTIPVSIRPSNSCTPLVTFKIPSSDQLIDGLWYHNREHFLSATLCPDVHSGCDAYGCLLHKFTQILAGLLRFLSFSQNLNVTYNMWIVITTLL